jgi:hypothetical protein
MLNYGSGIVLGIIVFPLWDIFWICCSVRFPCNLQHLGAGSCHFNGIWFRTSHVPLYLQHFAGKLPYQWYLQHV